MKLYRVCSFFLLISLVSACSKPEAPTAQSSVAWLRDGMIAISRPVPGVSQNSSQQLLGFMPITAAAHMGTWVSVDRANHLVSVMDGDKEVNVITGEGVEKLKPGIYQLLHKQRNALWYAPDSYFSARDLAIPAQGDRSRYRRGALGDFVLYIDKDTPIHNSPIWDDEIGGVRLDDADMSRLYYALEVGAAVEVR